MWARSPLVLDIGCGSRKRVGTLGIDALRAPGVDLVHDVNRGLPFADASVDGIYAWHAIEHLVHLDDFFAEARRVLKKGGFLEAEVPYWTNHRACDPGHYWYFSWMTINQLVEQPYLQKGKFEIVYNRILFFRSDHSLARVLSFIDRVVNASWKFTYFYDRFFAHLFPAGVLRFRLRAI